MIETDGPSGEPENDGRPLNEQDIRRIARDEARRAAQDEARRSAEKEGQKKSSGEGVGETVGGVLGDVAEGIASATSATADVVSTVSEATTRGCCLAEAASSGSCCLAEASFGVPDCFVATAALNSDRHADLDSLRAFRDTVLQRSAAGVLFVRFYYRWGAHAARLIRGRPMARLIVREGLVRPAARIARRITGR